MTRLLILFALWFLLPLTAHAQDQADTFKNVFSEGSWEPKTVPSKPSTGTTLKSPQANSGWQGRSHQSKTQPKIPPVQRNAAQQPESRLPYAAPNPVYAGSPQPLVLPTEETDTTDQVVYRPPAPDAELDLPPQVSGMIKEYDAALKKLKPQQIAYVENIVKEGYKLDEPLHQALIKTMEWKICSRSSLMSSFANKNFLKFKEAEEKAYLENVNAFDKGVLAKVDFMDTKIIKGKITAQGVISMSSMKQLYLLEASKASREKIVQDCEALAQFLSDYMTRNIF